jgi:hypothetical protein
MASTAGRQSSRVRTERATVSIDDFAAELFRLEQESESKNLLVYGDSNAGKTVLAGTCPGKTFWLVGEPGYKSAARRGTRGYGRRISDTATAWAAVDWLEQKERYRQLDWVVLDGMTTMQDRFRLGYAAEAFDIDPSKRQHRNLPDRPDYFNTQNFLKAWIPRLVDMPVNLLITAHAYRTDNTEDGELLVFPGIQGKVTETANAISGLMDATGYMVSRRITRRKKGEVTESFVRRRLWFDQPDRQEGEQEVRYIVGDKFGCLGPYIDNPTMTQIVAKIDGNEDEG